MHELDTPPPPRQRAVEALARLLDTTPPGVAPVEPVGAYLHDADLAGA